MKYTPAKYSLNLTNEFIDLIHSSDTNGILASLDVEILSTTALVILTIKIKNDYTYFHLNIPPPSFPKEIMEELLLMCTLKTHFLSAK